jgi:hypothetical protein
LLALAGNSSREKKERHYSKSLNNTNSLIFQQSLKSNTLLLQMDKDQTMLFKKKTTGSKDCLIGKKCNSNNLKQKMTSLKTI